MEFVTSKPAFFILLFVAFFLIAIINSVIKANKLKKAMETVFSMMATYFGFREVSTSQELYDLSEKIRIVHSNPGISYKVNVKRALKKEEMDLIKYFALADLSYSSSSSSASNKYEYLLYISDISYREDRAIYIRPRLNGLTEKLFSMVFSSIPSLEGIDAQFDQHYASYLFYMNRDEGSALINPEMREILLRNASRYPMAMKTYAMPEIIIGRGVIVVAGERTADQQHIKDMIALGDELTRKLNKQDKPTDEEESSVI